MTGLQEDDGAGERLSAKVFRHALDGLPSATYLTDAVGRIVYCNDAAMAVWGRKPRFQDERWCGAWRLRDAAGQQIRHEDSPMAMAVRTRMAVRGIEIVAEREDGSRVPLMPYPTPLFANNGALIGAVNMLVDLTERKRSEERIAFLAGHDELTGLPSRKAARAVAERMLQASAGGNYEAVALLFDLKDFRNFNDIHGIDAGDRLLVRFARLLDEVFQGALMTRMGGDEFGVLLRGPDARARAQALFTKLARLLAEGRGPDEPACDLGVRCGAALYPHDGTDLDTLFRHADAALHRAQASGLEVLRFFDRTFDAELHTRRLFRERLKHALDRSEFRIFYQPLFAISGRVTGFEALIRWEHPVQGLVSPGMFIPIAEESGQILAIGEWVLRQSCMEAVKWRSDVSVSVNVSPAQFRHDDLPEMVARALAESRLPPHRLHLEVTEGVLIDGLEPTLRMLNRLAALGVGMALDDFGTGYSSLSYLHALPFRTIKLDRSLLFPAKPGTRSQIVAASAVELSHRLGSLVVAEGVETVQHLQFAREIGSDVVQGYLLGRPQPSEFYADLMIEGRARHEMRPPFTSF